MGSFQLSVDMVAVRNYPTSVKLERISRSASGRGTLDMLWGVLRTISNFRRPIKEAKIPSSVGKLPRSMSIHPTLEVADPW